MFCNMHTFMAINWEHSMSVSTYRCRSLLEPFRHQTLDPHRLVLAQRKNIRMTHHPHIVCDQYN